MKTRRALLALALGLLAPSVAPLGAQSAGRAPGGPALHGFEPSGTYLLVVDGKPVPEAAIYESAKLPAVLVVAPSLPTPVLLRPGRKTVEAVPAELITNRDDGTVVVADAKLLPLGEFKAAGTSIAFAYGPKRASLDPKPALVGLLTAADVRQHDPHYSRAAAEYRPSPAAIAALQKVQGPVSVRVFFGSWCPVCKQRVPAMLQVEEALVGSAVTIEYQGLPLPPAAWKDPEAVRFKVTAVPTAIVFVGGKAVGRLIGQDWNTPEVELSRLVGAGAKRP
jgi:thiol-disulfide isomerase/thioredoxin